MGRGTLMVLGGKAFKFSGEGLTLDGARYLVTYIEEYGPRKPNGELVDGLSWLVAALKVDIFKYERWTLTDQGRDVVGRGEGDRPAGGGV
jgi:hypothetical protein